MRINELNVLLQDKKALLRTLALSLLYVVPLVLANYDYLDDFGRNDAGYGWQHDGRFLATLAGNIWSLNSFIVSVFPFTLILSSFILGCAGFLLTGILGIEKDKKIKWASLLIITAPVFLGNLVFKFDILPMALSLLTIVIPYAFYEKRKKFFFISVGSVFVSFALYQNSTTIFLIIGSVFLIEHIIKARWSMFFKDLLLVVSSFTAALVLYLLALRLLPIDLYVRGEFIRLESGFLGELLKNNKVFFERIHAIINSGQYKYILLLFLGFSLAGLLYRLFYKKTPLYGMCSLLLIMGILAVDFWLIAGVNLFLKGTYWDLRSFCGLGFFFMVCVKLHDYLNEPARRLSRISVLLMLSFSFMLMAQFGKLLTNQHEYQNGVAFTLSSYVKDPSVKKIALVGTLELAPNNRAAYRNFPIFNNLLSSPIGEYSFWSKKALNTNGMMDEIELIEAPDEKEPYELIDVTRWYRIKKVDTETLLIDFSKAPSR